MTARPNILILMSDDQGPWALGCAGTPEIRTPALDGLAAAGMRFTHFFCASPVCSPARASFLTGRMPSAHGVHDWIKSGNIDVPDGVTWCGGDRPIEYLRGLSGFTDVLATNGYRCGLSGKWHLGDSARPQKGHDFWCAHTLGGDHYMKYFVYDNGPAMEEKTQYVTDFFTDRAIDFLESHGRGPQPFCLSVHYTAPHAPWGRDNHPEALFALYEDCDFPSVPLAPPHPWGGWNPSPEGRLETLRGYCAAISGMDRAIGRLLERLETLGLRENTLVVFLADNGFNMGHHGILGKGNGTYPMNMFEESVKVPFIVSWPGRVPQGAVHDGLWSQYDFRPTLLDYLGLADPEADILPGRSFAGVLRGEPDEGREDVVIFDEYGPARMIRERGWKYVHRYPDGPHDLYDLTTDPAEDVNLADDPGHAATLARLREKLTAWFDRYADPARDGARLPVTGLGQTAMVGAGDAPAAFVPRRV